MSAPANNCGLYTITCVDTGKVYVGSSSNIRSRWGCHRSDLKRGVHPNPYLQNAWCKYGGASFVFSVLREVSRDLLSDEETSAIAEFRSADPLHGFNINPTGNSRLYRPHSEKTKFAMSAAKLGNISRLGQVHSEITKLRISLSQKGKQISLEQRQKLSDANKGKINSAETRAKISVANRGKSKPVGFGRKVSEKQSAFSELQVLNLRKLVSEGVSRRALARKFGVSHKIVGKAVDGVGPFYSSIV